MPAIKIGSLDITPSITGYEFLVLDDGVRTTRSTIFTVTNVLSTNIVQKLSGTIALSQLSAFITNYTDTLVQPLCVYTESSINAISAANNRVQLSAVETSFPITDNISGYTLTYTGYENITAFISQNTNTNGFISTLAQLSTGAITIRAAADYTDAVLTSYNDLLTLSAKGTVANITRTSNNNFFVAGIAGNLV